MERVVCSFYIDKILRDALKGEAKKAGISQGEVLGRAYDAVYGSKSDTVRLDYLLRNRFVLLPFRDGDSGVNPRKIIDDLIY